MTRDNLEGQLNLPNEKELKEEKERTLSSLWAKIIADYRNIQVKKSVKMD